MKLSKHFFTVLLTIVMTTVILASSVQAEGTVFVHLFEWSWNDIATECTEFLGPKGFCAVQVSPPQEHVQGFAWWTRYQPVKHELSNSRSGTRDEFIAMVNTCNEAGVDIYVDAVINHTSGGTGTGTDGSYFNGSSLDFPHYSRNDFHSPGCDIQQSDYGDNAWAVRNCNLAGLPDLDTGSAYVRGKLISYMNELIDLGVSGFRIDAAKHMLPSDLDSIISNLTGSPYVFQEVIDKGGEIISSSEYVGVADVTEFKYSGAISDKFLNGGVAHLFNLNDWGYLHSDQAVVFTDNHDNQRGHGGGGDTITYKNKESYELANVFMLAFPYGYPKVMSSYAFSNTDAGPPSSGVHNGSTLNCFEDDWQCEHRFISISNMVAFRNYTAPNFFVSDVWKDGNDKVAFGRGDLGFVVINRSNDTISRWFQTSLSQGEYCNVIASNNCSEIILVNSYGQAEIIVPPWSSAAIYGGKKNEGNIMPVAIIADIPNQVELGSTLYLDGTGSHDSDGQVVSYSWSNGDIMPSTSITLNVEGEQCFTLTVIDNEGAANSALACTYVGDIPLESNFKQVYLRGTPNGWGTSEMTLINNFTWSLLVHFTGIGDGSGEQRFKFDITGDWSENYGDNGQDGTLEQGGADILFNKTGSYNVIFDDQEMTCTINHSDDNQLPVAVVHPSTVTTDINQSIILSGADSFDNDGSIVGYNWSTGSSEESTIVHFESAGVYIVSLEVTDNQGGTSTVTASINVEDSSLFNSDFPTMNLRGTVNGWASSAMHLIADYTWEIDVTFDGSNSSEWFKFDVSGDWNHNFGDNDADGILEQDGDDILVDSPGIYTIRFFETDRTYNVVTKTNVDELGRDEG